MAYPPHVLSTRSSPPPGVGFRRGPTLHDGTSSTVASSYDSILSASIFSINFFYCPSVLRDLPDDDIHTWQKGLENKNKQKKTNKRTEMRMKNASRQMLIFPHVKNPERKRYFICLSGLMESLTHAKILGGERRSSSVRFPLPTRL